VSAAADSGRRVSRRACAACCVGLVSGNPARPATPSSKRELTRRWPPPNRSGSLDPSPILILSWQMDGQGPTRPITSPREFLCAGALVDHSDRNRHAPFENPYFAVPGVRTHWARFDSGTRKTKPDHHSKQVSASHTRPDRTNSTRAHPANRQGKAGILESGEGNGSMKTSPPKNWFLYSNLRLSAQGSGSFSPHQNREPNDRNDQSPPHPDAPTIRALIELFDKARHAHVPI
jgi:hypothetical protein